MMDSRHALLAHLSHWLMVSYCDHWMSVFRCVVHRQQLLQRTSPKLLAGSSQKPQGFDIWYIASSSRPLPSLFKLSPLGPPSPGVTF